MRQGGISGDTDREIFIGEYEDDAFSNRETKGIRSAKRAFRLPIHGIKAFNQCSEHILLLSPSNIQFNRKINL